MVDLDAVPRTYDEAVRLLASWHAGLGDDVVFYEVPDPDGRVVRLLEVSDIFPRGGAMRPDAEGRMRPIIPVFPLGPSADYPFRSEVAQITPDELDDVLSGHLPLSRPWDLSTRRRVEL